MGVYADEVERLRREMDAELLARKHAVPLANLGRHDAACHLCGARWGSAHGAGCLAHSPSDFSVGFAAGVNACLAVLPAGGLWDDLRRRLGSLTRAEPERGAADSAR